MTPLKSHADEQTRIRQYLLGQLPPTELQELEERILADGGFYEELLIAEDELIDEYLDRELSQAERNNFETHFLLAHELQQKVHFSRTLKRYISEAFPLSGEEVASESISEKLRDSDQPPPKKWFLSLPFRNFAFVSYLWVAAVLLLVCGVSWVLVNYWRSPAPQISTNVVTLVLTPGQVRDDLEQIKKIVLLPDTNAVRLQLELVETDYHNYRIDLMTSEGRTIWTKENLKPIRLGEQTFILIDVPAEVLKPNDYQVKVRGQLADGNIEDVARYAFRVR